MRMLDLIAKKRDGGILTAEEIQFMINGYVAGQIPDYQMSAMLMAIYFQGMTSQETATLTQAMAHSGDMVDLSPIQGIKVDKHSTGGVGDKTTMIVAPMVAAAGVKVAKMSGRGLGHTGGTVDKLESIPGFQTSMDREQFFKTVNEAGAAVIGQSGTIAPADKKLYALRDVTGTIGSIPLIASSIMSKKLAAGSDCILLDVKTGSGAFMKTIEDAISLGQAMAAIGEHSGRRTIALVTDMDIPLGNYIGNALEVKEAVSILRGQGPEDLRTICIQLASNMLYLARKGSMETCQALAEQVLADGSAFRAFKKMVTAQGGDASVLDHLDTFHIAAYEENVLSPADGYITFMDTEQCGIASSLLGAGRETKESTLDYSAGICLKKKTGDKVQKGDVIAILYTSSKEKIPQAKERFLNALTFGTAAPEPKPLILARISAEGVQKQE